MAFKMNGWSAGTGTGSSPNKRLPRLGRKVGEKIVKKGEGHALKALDGVGGVKRNRPAKKATTTTSTEPFMMSDAERKEAYMAKVRARVAELRARGESEAGIQRYVESEKKRLQEGKLDYAKHKIGEEGPGTYVKEGGSVKTSMTSLPMYSAERKAEYDRRGWAYDDTINKPKEEKKQNKPEADPTPDPTKVNDSTNVNDPEFAKKVKPNVGELTDPKYMRSSKKGRKTNTVVRQDDKIATDEYTERNIGDKRVRTYTGDPRGDVRIKEKFDKKGNKKKEKKKLTLADGTVVKTKTTRGGKKKVKIRKKGQLFARRVK